MGHKKARIDQQKYLWKQSLAKAQKDMVEQMIHQNNLLASQANSILLAEDSWSMVTDSLMSKDLSQMDDQAKRYYQLKRKHFLEQ